MFVIFFLPELKCALNDSSQPPSFSMPLKLLNLYGEANSYCFAVSCVPESVFNIFIIFISLRLISFILTSSRSNLVTKFSHVNKIKGVASQGPLIDVKLNGSMKNIFQLHSNLFSNIYLYFFKLTYFLSVIDVADENEV